MADPATWFLPFDAGDGRPWGDGTAMAAREAQGTDPWDVNNKVTSLIGGFEAMLAIREAFQEAIDGAAGAAAQDKGLVYIAGWRFNPQRDLSDANSWHTQPWSPGDAATLDQTAIGLVFRLLKAGVRVRIAVWLPTFLQKLGGLDAHIEDHYFLARAVEAESKLRTPVGDPPLGVVALDARVAEGSIAGAHHQKMMIFRGPTQEVALCGGVDLAFTRRDAPALASDYHANVTRFYNGDWQSGSTLPQWASVPPWPGDAGVTDYTALTGLDKPSSTQTSDLPQIDKVTGKDIYGDARHVWHDQHLKLEGPIVRSLEEQFRERWIDSARFYDLSNPGNTFGDQVIFSSADAIALNEDVEPLDPPKAGPAAAGTSKIQMWRTIPWRDKRTRGPFQRAEFTVMAGVNRAIQASQHLIWIFDQYLWSVPLARQLNFELNRLDKPDLRVIVILPPYADGFPDIIHEARRRALTELAAGGLADLPHPKVAAYALWEPGASGGRGIYCHAKVQTYDGSLLVCGSANMNRRSFSCDSELCCAVADEAVVAPHQERLWELLFGDVAGPAGTWPAPNWTAPNSGALFFEAFNAAAAAGSSHLRLDDWASEHPILANGVAMPRAVRGSPWADFVISHIADPSSLDIGLMERDVEAGENGATATRPARLDDVVTRIEKVERRATTESMPNRRQNSIIRVPAKEVELERGL